MDTVQLGVERIGQLAGAATWLDRVGRSIQQRPVLAHEMFPGRIISLGTRGGHREIGEVQRFTKPLDLARRGNTVGESTARARGKYVGERLWCGAPSRALSPAKE